MRHKKSGRKLGRSPSHRKSLLKNLMTSIIKYEKLETTTSKAKELRPKIEKLVTLARKNTVASKRQVAKVITQKSVLKKLFENIAPRYLEKPGGYTRIIKKGNRAGDNAEISIIEFV